LNDPEIARALQKSVATGYGIAFEYDFVIRRPADAEQLAGQFENPPPAHPPSLLEVRLGSPLVAWIFLQLRHLLQSHFHSDENETNLTDFVFVANRDDVPARSVDIQHGALRLAQLANHAFGEIDYGS